MIEWPLTEQGFWEFILFLTILRWGWWICDTDVKTWMLGSWADGHEE